MFADLSRRFQTFPEKMKKYRIFQTFPECYEPCNLSKGIKIQLYLMPFSNTSIFNTYFFILFKSQESLTVEFFLLLLLLFLLLICQNCRTLVSITFSRVSENLWCSDFLLITFISTFKLLDVHQRWNTTDHVTKPNL